ncbi:uncharacterized protein Fot_14307 [Forsythia ovata]|uniref:Uncharacterized protein n=1 Tax=Forsythia ovata TaxID=205694 RepID=A0ABD1W606_9LAMI
MVPIDGSDDSDDDSEIEETQRNKNKRTFETQYKKEKNSKKVDREKVGGAMFLRQHIGKLVEVLEVRNNVILRTDLPCCSISEIMQIFEFLPRVEKENEFWLLECQLFENEVKRQMFFTIKEPGAMH